MITPSYASMLFMALLAMVLLLVIPMLFPRSSFSVEMAVKVCIWGLGLIALLSVLIM